MEKKPTYEELEQRIRDLEKGKSAEKGLCSSVEDQESMYRHILENISDTVIVTDDQGNMVWVCPNTTNIFGFSQDQVYNQKTIQRLMNGTVCDISELKNQHEIKDIEWSITNSYGKTRYLLISAKSVNIIGGTVLYVMHDITERKQAEDALKQSEIRLKALSEAPFEAIFLSEKGVCIDQNQAAEDMFGYTRDEALGSHGTEWIVTEDRELVENNMLLGYEKPYEVTALRKDGRTFPCEIQARMVDYKSKSIRVTALRDITERIKAEESLRESEEKFKTVAEQSPNMIFINKMGRIVYTNKRSEALIGYENEEICSPEFNWLNLLAPESLELAKKSFKKHSRCLDIEPTEYTFLSKNGKRINTHINTKLIEYKGEKAILGIITDITARKQAEEALQQAHDKLKQMVKERTKELEEKTNRLIDLNAALNVLLEKRDQDKQRLAQDVVQNVQDLIQPMVDSLKNSGLNNHQLGYLEALESFLNEIASPFSGTLKAQYRMLTPTEVRVANLIRQGKTTKEIVQLLNSSEVAIKHHRRGIRKKLGITYQKVNLASHLASLSE